MKPNIMGDKMAKILIMIVSKSSYRKETLHNLASPYPRFSSFLSDFTHSLHTLHELLNP